MAGTWRRLREWTDREESDLGELIRGDRRRILQRIADGTAELYRIEGEGYRGALILAIEAEPETGARVLRIIAFRGEGSRELVADLERIARANECAALACEAREAAVQRLWHRIGFREIERAYRREIKA